MHTNTEFRKQLLNTLGTFIEAVEMDGEFVQLAYVESKRNLLAEVVDYYSDGLLNHAPFVAEFGEDEIEALCAFVRSCKAANAGAVEWTELRSRAIGLRTQLLSAA